MAIVDEIISLYNSEEVRDLSAVLNKLVVMLDQAHAAGENVPYSLELDIILAANYSFGYGGQLDQAQTIFKLLYKTHTSEVVSDHPQEVEADKIYRLACTACSALLSVMSTDTYNSERNSWKLLSWKSFSSTTTKAQILRAMMIILLDFFTLGSESKWKYELISFLVTIQAIISQLNTSIADEVGERLISVVSPQFDKLTAENLPQTISQWKQDWVEKNDYFRFTTLMITNNHAPEELWLEKIEALTGLSR